MWPRNTDNNNTYIEVGELHFENGCMKYWSVKTKEIKLDIATVARVYCCVVFKWTVEFVISPKGQRPKALDSGHVPLIIGKP